MSRPRLRVAAAVLTALTPLVLAGPASGAPAAHHPMSPLRQAVLSAPHPGLHACRDAYAIERVAGNTLRSRNAVVQLTCHGATGSSPQEISVWRRIAGHIGRVYYLVPGGRRLAGNARLLAAGFARQGANVVVRYLGYLPDDATCCPSRAYRQRFSLRPWTVHRGRLVRTR